MSAISIDPAFVIANEISYITSAMRKNARWANSGMASILGVPPMSADEDDSLASRLGLRSHNESIGSVCMALNSKCVY